MDALKHASNAYQKYCNVRKPRAKPTVFKLEKETKEEEATALLNMVREEISGEDELDVSNWSPLRLSAFSCCITETFDVLLALYNDKKDGDKAGPEVKQGAQTDEENRVQGEEEKKHAR